MIAKITSGNTVEGCLEYQSKDDYMPKKNKSTSEEVDSKYSKLIDIQNTFFPEADLSKILDHNSKPKELTKMFKKWNEKNPKIKANVFHCSLNFHSTDKVSEDKLKAISNEFMESMGYKNVPYVVYQHFDAGHTHIHIVSSRIDENGKKVKDSNEIKRAMELCRVLEEKHNLKPVNSQYIQEFNRSLRSNLSDSDVFNKGYVSRCLKSALLFKENRDLSTLSQHLLEKYQIKLFSREGRLSFAHSKDGKKPIFGSRIEKNLYQKVLRQLSKNQSQYNQYLHNNNLQAFKGELRESLKVKNTIDREQFQSMLSKYGLKLNSVVRKSREEASYFQNYIGQSLVQKSYSLQQFELIQKNRELNDKSPVLSQKINASSFSPVNSLIQNPLFRAAKDGSRSKAEKLIEDLYKKQSFSVLKKYPEAIIVPMPSLQSKIPVVLAQELSKEYKNAIDDNCQFLAKIKAEKEGIWQKILLKPKFAFPVEKGKKYFLTDDVFVTGQHIKSLKNHIEKGGGEVIGFACLASRNRMDISLSNDLIEQANKQFGKEDFNNYLLDYGIADNINGLTPIELNYFLDNFETLSKLKERTIEEFFALRDNFIGQAQENSYNEVYKKMEVSQLIDKPLGKPKLEGGYNFEFSFSSLDEKGNLIYQDDKEDIKQHSRLLQEHITDLSFLDLKADEAIFLTNQKVLNGSVIQLIQSNEKNPFYSFESLVRNLKSHGFSCKINYEKDKIDSLMKMQKFVITDTFKDKTIELDLMNFNHFRYNKNYLNSLFQAFCSKYPNDFKQQLESMSKDVSKISLEKQILLRTVFESSYSEIAKNPSYFKKILSENPNLLGMMDKDKIDFIQKFNEIIPKPYRKFDKLNTNNNEGIYSVEQKQDDDYFLR